MTKDSITFLTPLDEEQLDLKNESASGAAEIKFSDVFKNMTGNYMNKKNKKKLEKVGIMKTQKNARERSNSSIVILVAVMCVLTFFCSDNNSRNSKFQGEM